MAIYQVYPTHWSISAQAYGSQFNIKSYTVEINPRACADFTGSIQEFDVTARLLDQGYDVVGVFAFKFCKDKTNLADCLSLYKINLGLEGDGNILFSRVLSQKRIIVSQPLRKDINGCHKRWARSSCQAPFPVLRACNRCGGLSSMNKVVAGEDY